jgi:arsenate reductase (thioredoxin)
MDDRLVSVLFICTGNSARSIIAEAILNHTGRGRFVGFSAGSHPKGQVNPLALKVLSDAGISTEGLRSKAWEEFADPQGPPIDFVITVCDAAAREVCPIWLDRPTTAHWGVPDPVASAGSDQQRIEAFHDAFKALERRVHRFIALPISNLDHVALSNHLREIGRS